SPLPRPARTLDARRPLGRHQRLGRAARAPGTQGEISVEPTVAVIGATGAVGDVFLRVAAERNLPMKKLKLLASARSKGKVLQYAGQDIVVEETTEAALEDADIVFCSASSEV